MQTLQPDFLTLDEGIIKLIPPRASGRGKTRESFKSKTGVTFDGVSLAETAAAMTAAAMAPAGAMAACVRGCAARVLAP